MSDTYNSKGRSVDEALNFATMKSVPEPFWKVIISTFIVVYFGAVIIWLFTELPYQREIAPYAGKVNIVTGGVQFWALFCPDVRHTIYHETAVITFQDGAMKLYEFPRMEKMELWEKFKHEKLRKIFSDCIPWPGYEAFLPSVSQYLANCNQIKGNQPTMLTMIFNSATNPPPDEKNWTYREKLPSHTRKDITFIYGVRQSDLIGSSTESLRKQSNLRLLDIR